MKGGPRQPPEEQTNNADEPINNLRTALNALVGRLDRDVAANDRVETICNRMMSRVNEFFEGVEEFYKMRIELMERLDRLQNEQTKQRTEMEALIELMRDTSPSALLLRIRQQEDEIRELKGDRP